MLLSETEHLQHADFISGWTSSHQPAFYYFPISAHSDLFYSLITEFPNKTRSTTN